MIILKTDRIKKIEEAANANGLSFKKMTENAGTGCAGFILSHFAYAEKITVLCGKGTNGADGFVMAKKLCAAGKKVTVIKLFQEQGNELSDYFFKELPEQVSIVNFGVGTDALSQILFASDIIADACFGTGFSGTLPKYIETVFGICTLSKAVKIAIDIPSGLSAKAFPEGGIFKADYTLSMLAFKYEQVYSPWREYCGETHVISIGIDVHGKTSPSALSLPETAALLPRRPFNSNKGTFGKALIFAGSQKMPGAAVINANGALMSGAGLVQLAFPDVCTPGITSKLSECIFLPLPSGADGEFSAKAFDAAAYPLKSCTAVAIGCGMGTGKGSTAFLQKIVSNCSTPLLIDADGINILAMHKDVLMKAKCPVLITPHPGEMARLTGKTVAEVNASREKTAYDLAKKYNIFVLLKGANTVIAAPDGRININPTGCNALSRGGSGDLLTGIITAMLASGVNPFDALCLGAYIHGSAGEEAAKKYSPQASTVARIAECLTDAFIKSAESK